MEILLKKKGKCLKWFHWIMVEMLKWFKVLKLLIK